MQRDLITLADVAQRDNLLLATWKAARGKRQRPAVSVFLSNLEDHLANLARAILAGRAPMGPARQFVIHDPKRRLITAASFEDRVLHHAIVNRAEPRLERMLVDSSFACRPGRGVHAAVAAVQQHLHRAQAWPWLVQVDVNGYFPSIEHAILKALLARRFKGAGFLALLGRIIDSGGDAGRGLPIGALTSQHFANAYLDAADRWLREQPGVGAHVRYMDDIVWWCDSQATARRSLADLQAWLWAQRALRLKPSAHIGRSVCGLAFCGFRIRPGVVLASSRKMSRYRAGLARIGAAAATGLASEAELQRAQAALLGTMAGAQTLGFRRGLLA